MKLIDGTRVDSPWGARNPLRETILRLDDMAEQGVDLRVEYLEKLGENELHFVVGTEKFRKSGALGPMNPSHGAKCGASALFALHYGYVSEAFFRNSDF